MTLVVLAAPVERAIEDNKVSPGVLGFLVVAALGVATWLLIRSMNRQLHKIDFSEDAIDVERKRPSVPEIVPDAASPEPEPDGPAHPVPDGEDSAGPDGQRSG